MEDPAPRRWAACRATCRRALRRMEAGPSDDDGDMSEDEEEEEPAASKGRQPQASALRGRLRAPPQPSRPAHLSDSEGEDEEEDEEDDDGPPAHHGIKRSQAANGQQRQRAGAESSSDSDADGSEDSDDEEEEEEEEEDSEAEEAMQQVRAPTLAVCRHHCVRSCQVGTTGSPVLMLLCPAPAGSRSWPSCLWRRGWHCCATARAPGERWRARRRKRRGCSRPASSGSTSTGPRCGSPPPCGWRGRPATHARAG